MSLVTKLATLYQWIFRIIFKNGDFGSEALWGPLEPLRSPGMVPEHHPDVQHHIFTPGHAAVTRSASHSSGICGESDEGLMDCGGGGGRVCVGG